MVSSIVTRQLVNNLLEKDVECEGSKDGYSESELVIMMD
jgi:hypothetical protein